MVIGMVADIIAVCNKELVFLLNKLFLSEGNGIIYKEAASAAKVGMLLFKLLKYSYCAVRVNFFLSVFFDNVKIILCAIIKSKHKRCVSCFHFYIVFNKVFKAYKPVSLIVKHLQILSEVFRCSRPYSFFFPDAVIHQYHYLAVLISLYRLQIDGVRFWFISLFRLFRLFRLFNLCRLLQILFRISGMFFSYLRCACHKTKYNNYYKKKCNNAFQLIHFILLSVSYCSVLIKIIPEFPVSFDIMRQYSGCYFFPYTASQNSELNLSSLK